MYTPQNMHLEQLASPNYGSNYGSSPGSPMDSMSAGGANSTPGAYLPGYLLGETSFTPSPSLGRMWPMTKSPTKTRSNLPSSGGQATSPNRSMMSPAVARHRGNLSRPYPSRPSTDKHGGPPTQGLFESFNSSSASLALGSPALNGSSVATGARNTAFPTDELYMQPQFRRLNESLRTPASPSQLDPFYTQGEALSPHEELDETWVTVFGFPPAAASYLLQQFSQYGTISEHKMSSGNWMHLRYQSKLQAKKALSKNGKIFSDTIMVGVAQCIDKTVMDSGKENTSVACVTGTPLQLENTSMCRSDKRNSSIRSLTQAYRVSAADRDVVQNGATPQKDTGLVSKSMKYLFGW